MSKNPQGLAKYYQNFWKWFQLFSQSLCWSLKTTVFLLICSQILLKLQQIFISVKLLTIKQGLNFQPASIKVFLFLRKNQVDLYLEHFKSKNVGLSWKCSTQVQLLKKWCRKCLDVQLLEFWITSGRALTVFYLTY